MASDLTNPIVYDQASAEQRLSFLTQQITAVGISAQQAKARNDQADLANLLVIFRNLSNQAAQLRDVISQAQTPSAFMQAWANLADQALTYGQSVGGAFLDTAKNLKNVVDDTLKGTSLLVKFLPWLIGGVVVVGLVILYRSRSLGFGNVKVRR